MKAFWGLLVALSLSPILSQDQRPAQPVENAHPTYSSSIPHQTQQPEETTLYFPDYVDGGGWSVQLALSNFDAASAAEVDVEVYDQGGQVLVDFFDSETTFEIPALGSRVLRSEGVGAIRRGWVQVQSDTASVGGLLTYRDAQTGFEVGVEPVPLRDQFALFVEESGDIGTGLAIFKPDVAPSIELRIRDQEGDDPLEGVFIPWGDFNQAARTLPEWFDVAGVDTGFLTDFRGLLLLRSEDESFFAPLGLRFGKRNPLFSAVPAVRNQRQQRVGTTLYFPDYVDGDGWSVQLALSNVDAASGAEVGVEVHDQDGLPLVDFFDSETTFEIPSLGSRVLRSEGVGAIRRGWIRVRSETDSVRGLLIYREAPTGVEVSVEPVQLGDQFALFVEETSEVGAGLAIFKPGLLARVELQIRDEEGNDPSEGVLPPWGDFNQAARTLPEWFDVEGIDRGFLTDFRGLLFLRTEDKSLFAPLGLRFGKASGSLSAVPAVRIPVVGGMGDEDPPSLAPTVTMSASPSSIDWGQSATLTWSSTNAVSANITPGIGAVPASGSRKVSPTVTTTYRITVRGADGEMQTATASTEVTVISERAALRALYQATGGPDWTQSENWLTGRPLGEWFGVYVDDGEGRVMGLSLPDNNLRGSIPAELGSLATLRSLSLYGNNLTGPIPAELGSLANLEVLWLGGNDLEGSIPAELGSLTNLRSLDLYGNNLTGSIPAELGSLTNLEVLWLYNNDLTGSIPAELGSLTNLHTLYLSGNNLKGLIPGELGSLTNLASLSLARNNLTGPIPAELGSLTNLSFLRLSHNNLAGPIPAELGWLISLREMVLSRNARMFGALPASLTNLDRLEALLAGDTGLCAPSEARFLDWLDGVWKQRVAICAAGDPPAAYLTQAVQSRQFPVPLVADEKALLRVFVTAPRATDESLPPVRATFYLDGEERYVADIPGKPVPIPNEVSESGLDTSANIEIPDWVVQPGLEMVIDVDPEGTLSSTSGVTKRIPESGRLAVAVRAMPVFDLTVIPFRWNQAPDKSVVELAQGMALDPEGHSLLWHTRTLLPVGESDVIAHASVLSSTNNIAELLSETKLIRVMEGASGHYLGMMAGEIVGAAGAAYPYGWSTFSSPESLIIAHGIGHNFGLFHAPCGFLGDSDPFFPETDGSIGVWGYDFRSGGDLVPPTRPDLMSYCRPAWISDYHFSNALRFRLRNEGRAAVAAASAATAAPAKAILLWGGVNAGGVPFLEPAFVVDAPAALPRPSGEYEIIGRTGGGQELFSLKFEMPEVADGDGRSSFVFALPVRSGWAGRLASITLSGPGGSVTLDEETDRPMTIFRDPRTGEVRGILRGQQAAALTPGSEAAALALEPGLEMLTSRGMPDREDWER